METIRHWIDGRPAGNADGATVTVYNPATGQPRAQILPAGAIEVDAAVQAAEKAFLSWSQTSLSRRTEILFEFRRLVRAHADACARLVTAEHGKVLSDARGEIQRGLEVVEFACGIPELLKGDYSDQVSTGVDSFSFRQPLGVVAGITPFNFPVMVPMWMFPLAIACGNTFILKPSERDPSASVLLAQLWSDAGLPDGVFNVVHGDKATVDALLRHRGIAAVSFVGSTPIARHVHEHASATGKRVQALGGAKNHAVVMPDADIDFAAQHLVAAAFGSAGQRCMAISVAVAVGESAEPLVQALRTRVSKIAVGPGDAPNTDMGPVITQEAKDRVRRYVSDAIAHGANAVTDGRDIDVAGYPEGFFVGPTVLDGVTPDMSVYRDEVFGPVLSVLRCATLEEAIEAVNANPYGNGTSIFTRSGNAARKFQRAVTVGMVGVNVPIPVPMAYHSFGGWKNSLFGDTHVHGNEGVRFYTRGKVVTSRWPEMADPASASYSFPTAE